MRGLHMRLKNVTCALLLSSICALNVQCKQIELKPAFELDEEEIALRKQHIAETQSLESFIELNRYLFSPYATAVERLFENYELSDEVIINRKDKEYLIDFAASWASVVTCLFIIEEITYIFDNKTCPDCLLPNHSKSLMVILPKDIIIAGLRKSVDRCSQLDGGVIYDQYPWIKQIITRDEFCEEFNEIKTELKSALMFFEQCYEEIREDGYLAAKNNEHWNHCC